MIPWLAPDSAFPPVSSAQTDPNGLLAAGADLSPARLLDAYRLGIFPWYSEEQPVLWWSPNPRMVLVPTEFSPSRSLSRSLRNSAFEIRFDTAFRDVIRACAAPRNRREGTWIVGDVIEAYSQMHELGYAHSVETWHNDELVGGLYGLAIGRMFYGESMFSRVTDASKIAFAHLVAYLRNANFGLIDCQMSTPHLASLGAREIPREDFCTRVAELINYPAIPEKWTCHQHAYVIPKTNQK